MSARKRDAYEAVIGEDEFFDDGLTEELCPDCGKKLRWRDGKWRNKFLGCTAFPKCRFTSYRKTSVTKK